MLVDFERVAGLAAGHHVEADCVGHPGASHKPEPGLAGPGARVEGLQQGQNDLREEGEGAGEKIRHGHLAMYNMYQ